MYQNDALILSKLDLLNGIWLLYPCEFIVAKHSKVFRRDQERSIAEGLVGLTQEGLTQLKYHLGTSFLQISHKESQKN